MQNNTFSNKSNTRFSQFLNSKGMSAVTAALLAIVLGLIFGFIVMLIASPMNAIYGFNSMLLGGFARIGDVFYFATPILMTGLSVGFAFKMGLFNIGASGQYTMGMFFAMYVGFMWKLPNGIHWIVCILAGMIGGMIWGFIPGILKALLNVNEVITSIMFNYIGMYLVDMLVSGNAVMYISSMSRTAYLPTSAQLPSLGVPNSNVNVAIIIAILIAVTLYIVLNKTTFGYELKATGFNKHASKYAGMSDTKNTILTMVIAGGLSGLGGAFAILAPSTIAGSSMTYEPINIIAANGFTGIAVALLGSSNPIGIVFSALFISHIQRGGTLASSLFGYKPEIIDVVIAVIIYFSAFAMIMNAAVGKLIKKRRDKKAGKNNTELAKKTSDENMEEKNKEIDNEISIEINKEISIEESFKENKKENSVENQDKNIEENKEA